MKTNAARTVAIIMLMVTGTIALAQSDVDACPSFVRQSYEFTQSYCGIVQDGQACIGSGQVSSTPVAGTDFRFETPGDRANLADIQRFQTRTMTADSRSWTTVTARLETSTEDGSLAMIDLLAVGDVVMWQAGESASVDSGQSQIQQATILAETGVMVRQEARGDSALVWQLRDGSSIQAFGRSADGQWIRILLPSRNGGAGWVFGRFVAVDGGSELLPIHTNDTPIASSHATVSVPAYRMESLPASENCPESPDSGILLQSSLDRSALVEVNGVELEIAGTVFLTAQVVGSMSVHSLEGESSMLVNGVSSNLRKDTVSVIPMDDSLQPATAPGQPRPFAPSFSSRVRYLPIQLLARDIGAPADPAAAEATSPAAAICPNSIHETYDKTSIYCADLGADQVCLGNAGASMIDLVPRLQAANLGFALPGDVISIHYIDRLSMNVAGDPQRTWPVVTARLEANISEGERATATLIMFGDLELVNRNDDMLNVVQDQLPNGNGLSLGRSAQIQVSGRVSVLAQPRIDTDTIALADDSSELMALGLSVDRQWIRVQTQDGLQGWVVERFLTVEGGTEALPVIGANAGDTGESSETDAITEIVLSADNNKQVFNFVTLDEFPSCSQVPPSGILIQSPAETGSAVLLIANGADLAIVGTAFLTASHEILTIYGLEGATLLEIDGARHSVYAGEQVRIPLIMGQVADASHIIAKSNVWEDVLRLSALPIQLLPRHIEDFLPLPEDVPIGFGELTTVAEPEIVVMTTDGEQSTSPKTQLAESETMSALDECVISAGGFARNIRQGPGTDYQIVDVLRAGQAMIGKTQKRGTYGLYWYNTDRGWIRFDAGEMTGACERLPLHVAALASADVVRPLNNEILGDVCAAGGAYLSATVRGSGTRFHEFAGLWTGQAGTSVTFTAEIPYFHGSFGNVITFTDDDGSLWLGSSTNTDFTVYFAETQDFHVRVSGLLGDHVTLRVSC